MAKVIMHIDLNAFFASAEVLADPSLKGKPLIVAGAGRRGIVSTASYEARAYGIHSAMPTYQALRLCSDVIIREPNFSLYKHYSQRFFAFVSTHVSKVIEVASVDECYVDATAILSTEKEPLKFVAKLQQTLLKEIGLACSIGIGPTKFLAKMASDAKKPLGITVYRRKDLATTLWLLPISKMYGVGKATAPRLERLGIKTIGDLVTTERPDVISLLGKSYYTLSAWAKGLGSDEVQVEEDDPKSIGNSSTFYHDTNDYEELSQLFKDLSTSVSERAKKERKLGKTIQIVIRYYDFTTINRSITISKATNSASIIYNEAMRLFEKKHQGELIRLLGVTLQNLVDQDNIKTQLSLFDDFTRKTKTEVIIDLLNETLEKPSLLQLSALKEDKSN